MKRIVGASLIAAIAAIAAAAPLAAQPPTLITSVRAAIARQDFAAAEGMVAAHRSANGVTAEMLEALSWLGRGTLAAKQFSAAEGYARQTYKLAAAELKRRPLDQEAHLPIALGAAIEVLAHVMVAQGARTEAIGMLDRELKAHRGTSVEKRIQKNIHLLSLVGKPAPPIQLAEHLGPAPTTLGQLKGKVVLLFFWAHWCSDCKSQAPILARIASKYRDRGLTLVAPTQRFGFVAGGTPAGAAEETRYIDDVRRTSYPVLEGVAVPLSAANHTRYGVSSTPTLVLVDRGGIVRLYHPGRITEQDLDAHIASLMN
jgi:thiol-disulfide isomerase/thioredoxin